MPQLQKIMPVFITCSLQKGSMRLHWLKTKQHYKQVMLPSGFLKAVYIWFNCTNDSFVVCCCVVSSAGTYSGKNKCEQGRGSTVCVRAQEGSVKSLWQSSTPLAHLPPETTAIKPVVGCQSPLAVFFHKAQAQDLITQRKLDDSLLQETGWQSCVTVQQGTPLWSLRRGLSICMSVFSDIITNRISKLIKKEKEQDILTSPLLCWDYSLRRLRRRRLCVVEKC